MNNGGDAAEQVVRLSLEGFEVAAKLTGSAAKNVALLLVSVLKQEQQTKGKARLTNMIKSGKELKVFSIRIFHRSPETYQGYGSIWIACFEAPPLVLQFAPNRRFPQVVLSMPALFAARRFQTLSC